MAETTSGTTSWNLDVDEIALDAIDMLGGQPQLGYEPRQARRALNLLLTEWVNRGIPLWKVPSTPNIITVTQGTSAYNSVSSAEIDVIEGVLRRANQDLTMQRLSLAEWLALPNKQQTGRPTHFMVNRQRDQFTITLWPVPENSTDQFVYWPFSRMQDVTASFQLADVPFRFLPALTAGLAYFMGLRRPGVPDTVIARVKARYEEALEFATQEDRERVDFRFVPKMGPL